jgi:hypothetical protein
MRDSRTVADRLGPGWDVVSWTVVAANEAADRLLALSWTEPRRAFAAVGETLWWVTTLDDTLDHRLGAGYREARQRERMVRQLQGMRHARNRIAHAFDVLEPVEPGGNPAGREYGSPGYWRWRHLPPDSREAPKGLAERRAAEHAAYEAVLADHLVQSTLTQVLTFLRSQAWIQESGPASTT